MFNGKRMIVTLIAGLLGGSQAAASLQIDCKLVAIDGINNPADPLLNGAWNATANLVELNKLAGPSHVFSVQIVATVRGTDSAINERFQSAQGSVQAANGSLPKRAAHGIFVPTGDALFLDGLGNPDPSHARFFAVSPFANLGAQNGNPTLNLDEVVPRDLSPQDGNMDFGEDPIDSLGAGNLVAMRAASLQAHAEPFGAGSEGAGGRWVIGRFDWNSDHFSDFGETIISWKPRRTADLQFKYSAGLWEEDGTGFDHLHHGERGELLIDQPGQNLTLLSVPEPSTVMLAFSSVLFLSLRCRKTSHQRASVCRALAG